MQVYSQYSGTKDPERDNVCAFVTTFVKGLRHDIKDNLRQAVICWEAKGIEEILKYTKCSSDWVDIKKERR